MKKIIGLGIAVAVIIALVTTGTWAFFSDTETSSPNTFTAGTIDLEVNTENPWASAAVTTELEDLKPCETGYVTITLKNVGDNEMDVWKMIKGVSCSGGTNTYPSGTPVASSEPEWQEGGGVSYTETCDIDTVIIYDMWIEVGGDPLVCEPGSGDLLIVDEATGLHIDDIATNYIYLDTLAKDATMTVVQSYHMDEDTTNWAQGDEMTFTIEFFGQQTAGSPTSPTPELSGYGK